MARRRFRCGERVKETCPICERPQTCLNAGREAQPQSRRRREASRSSRCRVDRVCDPASRFRDGGSPASAFQRRPVLDHARGEPDPRRPQPVAEAERRRLHGADGAEPPLRAAERQVLRRDPARRRDPPPSRRVAEQRQGGRRRGQRLRRRPLPVHGRGRGEDDLRRSRPATAIRSARTTPGSSTT